MKYIKKVLFFTVLFVAMYACSTKKNTVINRNYHVLNTHFNILFNGKQAFKKGIEDINQGYKDDWFQQLPIEPIAFDEYKMEIPTFKNNGSGFDNNDKKEQTKAATSFERAEEKAVKAIQKHGMNIKGFERNSQIDDAYLLLGKARYYSQRFVPAIEAFNYIIANYWKGNLITETKIWRSKANIRIDNEEFAIESMKFLLYIDDTYESNISDEIKEQINTTLAMAYVKTDSLQKAKNI